MDTEKKEEKNTPKKLLRYGTVISPAQIHILTFLRRCSFKLICFNTFASLFWRQESKVEVGERI
jgi:hypothetical protein